MRMPIKLSLILNIAVLVPIGIALAVDAPWIASAYGPFTAARGILLSIYIAIGLFSVLLLFVDEPKFVAALLLVQVVYKLTTPITVGTIWNPVVISNLIIAAFHTITLILIFRSATR
ncbi:MAG: hypothetical protein HC918_04740 [Oscillatoriales cyanobacterium SM2_1_8]|nr:hypothetical protein [Oscillatoriales cyanobacterium SM2_1_8]